MLNFKDEINFINRKLGSALDNPKFSYMTDGDFQIYIKDFISENLSSFLEDFAPEAIIKWGI